VGYFLDFRGEMCDILDLYFGFLFANILLY
jgi:hypothetical protein